MDEIFERTDCFIEDNDDVVKRKYKTKPVGIMADQGFTRDVEKVKNGEIIWVKFYL